MTQEKSHPTRKPTQKPPVWTRYVGFLVMLLALGYCVRGVVRYYRAVTDAKVAESRAEVIRQELEAKSQKSLFDDPYFSQQGKWYFAGTADSFRQSILSTDQMTATWDTLPDVTGFSDDPAAGQPLVDYLLVDQPLADPLPADQLPGDRSSVEQQPASHPLVGMAGRAFDALPQAVFPLARMVQPAMSEGLAALGPATREFPVPGQPGMTFLVTQQLSGGLRFRVVTLTDGNRKQVVETKFAIMLPDDYWSVFSTEASQSNVWDAVAAEFPSLPEAFALVSVRCDEYDAPRMVMYRPIVDFGGLDVDPVTFLAAMLFGHLQNNGCFIAFPDAMLQIRDEGTFLCRKDNVVYRIQLPVVGDFFGDMFVIQRVR